MNEYKVAAYEKEELHRNLKSRHIEMIAIGGAMGHQNSRPSHYISLFARSRRHLLYRPLSW